MLACCLGQLLVALLLCSLGKLLRLMLHWLLLLLRWV